MKKERLPDRVLAEVYEITPEWLREHGIKGVFADLDNTLAKYGQKEPTQKVSDWINGLKKAGIPLVIISNNKHPRVSAFCSPYGLEFISKSGKPRPGALLETAAKLGLEPHEVAMVGDQIFTDVTAAKRAGMFAVIVTPLSKNIFFTARRLFEQRYIRHAVSNKRRLP